MKKHFLVRRCLLAVLAVVLVAGISACSSGGGGGDTGTLDSNTTTTTGGEGGTTTNPGPVSANQVQLSGTIAAGAGAQGLSGMRAAAVADAVWAVPIAKMQGANIDPVNFMLRKTASLATDGTFSFQLEKTMTLAEIKAKVPTIDTGGMPDTTVFDVDWMLVQMAGGAPTSVIALQGDAAYDSLLSIPLSAFTPSTINVGTVNGATGVANLSVSSLASNVTMSASSLAALARTDDILGAIKDVIRNCDLTTNKCKSANQAFVFMGTYANLIDPVNYDKGSTYTGYQLYFDLNDYFDKTDFDGICPGASGSVTVEYQLTPPSPISIGSATYSSLSSDPTDTGNPTLTGDGTETRCFKNNLYVNKSNSTNTWNLQFITGDIPAQLTTSTPAGDWVLSRKTLPGGTLTEIGRFEFSLAKPVDGSGNPIVFVPALRLDTDGAPDFGVTTAHVKWYQYIGSGYVEVTDAALLDSQLGSYEISLDDENGLGTGNLRRAQQWGIPFSTATIDVSNLDGNGKFCYGYIGELKYSLKYIGISYMFGGQNFRFAWRID